MDYRIRLSTPHMGGSELKYIHHAFNSNWIAPAGSNISGFEKDLEDYLGREVHAVALSSGTAAIHLALKLSGVQQDDEVICQSFTFSASAFPICYLGAKPVFVGSEKDTWNMCPKYLEQAIQSRISEGKKPKAIVVVHVYGMPAKINEILTISDKYGVPIIEDAAEALGSEYYGQKCGTFGDYAILSFNGNKMITTSGGGALIVRSESIKNKAIFLATQAKENTSFYQHAEIGYNYRLSNILAGIGRGQMEVLSTHIHKRQLMHQFYKKLFKPFNYIKVFSEYDENLSSNHWLTCIRFSAHESLKTPEGLRSYLEKLGIESRFLWKPMHIQPVFKDSLYFGDLTSETLFDKGLCLPSGSNLDDNDRRLISECVLEYLNN